MKNDRFVINGIRPAPRESTESPRDYDALLDLVGEARFVLRHTRGSNRWSVASCVTPTSRPRRIHLTL